jgi:hypothetical protein
MSLRILNAPAFGGFWTGLVDARGVVLTTGEAARLGLTPRPVSPCITSLSADAAPCAATCPRGAERGLSRGASAYVVTLGLRSMSAVAEEADCGRTLRLLRREPSDESTDPLANGGVLRGCLEPVRDARCAEISLRMEPGAEGRTHIEAGITGLPELPLFARLAMPASCDISKNLSSNLFAHSKMSPASTEDGTGQSP